jgi:hypothetical protein
VQLLEQGLGSGAGLMLVSRRRFLLITGAAALAPNMSLFGSTDKFPALLDHIILACSDLNQGIAFIEEHTGVRAALGGVHPDRGTRNALLSLGAGHYLEILAPDPQAQAVQPSAMEQLTTLKALTRPTLTRWAVQTRDIEALAKKFRDAGMEITGPSPGSRKRPDGQVLSWKRLEFADDRHGLLPFFIEWSADSIHPSSNSPQGCHLERFTAADKNPSNLSKTFARIGIEMTVERDQRPQLRARITGPKGVLDVGS